GPAPRSSGASRTSPWPIPRAARRFCGTTTPSPVPSPSGWRRACSTPPRRCGNRSRATPMPAATSWCCCRPRRTRPSSTGSPAPFAGCDFVVAADGVRSVLRSAYADQFRSSFSPTASKYVWFGADFALPVFTFIFNPTPHGLFQVHSYPYDAHRSTFIVECSEAAWRSAGLDTMGEADSLAFCQALFEPYLGGHRLLSNESVWRTFVTVRN